MPQFRVNERVNSAVTVYLHTKKKFQQLHFSPIMVSCSDKTIVANKINKMPETHGIMDRELYVKCSLQVIFHI